jgi:SagB-type dehydrogenase family enzyme
MGIQSARDEVTRRYGGLYRRSASVVAYADGDRFVADDFALGTCHDLTPELAALLTALSGWTTVAQAVVRLPFLDADTIRNGLATLQDWGLVESSRVPADPRREAVAAWRQWFPHAAFFHFGTKDIARADVETAEENRRLRLLFQPAPAPLKGRPRGVRSIVLPPAQERGQLARVLLERRSWRHFGTGAVRLADLSTLLGLTWGVRRWMHVTGGRRALKTSPSPGACHPVEAYVIAERVQGLSGGVYHYCPDRHALTRIRRDSATQRIGSLLRQPWFDDAAFVVAMTAIWSRVHWKYSSSRTYRSVLMEVGHHAQTFELVATSLKLAPFCTGAFSDRDLERTLGVDGVEEGVLFVVGAGARPAGVSWAPWREAERIPKTTAPTHLRRSHRRRAKR